MSTQSSQGYTGAGSAFQALAAKERGKKAEACLFMQQSLLSRRKAFSLNTTPSRCPCHFSLVRTKSYAHTMTNQWQRTWDYHIGLDKPASPDAGSLRPEQNQGILNKEEMLSDNEKCLPQPYFLYWRSKCSIGHFKESNFSFFPKVMQNFNFTEGICNHCRV